MRVKHLAAFSLLMAFMLGLVGAMQWLLPAQASSPYAASSVLSQPELTQGRVNANGFRGVGTMALDTIHHRLFVADTGNYRVLMFNLNNSNQLTDRQADAVLGQTSFTRGEPCDGVDATSYCSGIIALSVDASGNRLYVSDERNNRVLEYDISGAVTTNMAPMAVIGRRILPQTTLTLRRRRCRSKCRDWPMTP